MPSSFTLNLTRSPTRDLTRAITDAGGGGGGPFDPTSLFTGGYKGIIHDYGTSSLLFQSSAGTGAVSTNNDPIGYVSDAGPTSRPGLQATAANRPVWSGVPRTLGSELVSNGRFASDTVWTKGTDWTIAASKASKTAGTASLVSQPITVTAGKTYFITYVMERTAGTLTPQFTGGTTVAGAARNIAGSFIEVFIAATGNTTLEFSADAAFAGSLSNVTIKEVLTFTNMGAFFDGVNDGLVTASVDLTAGDKMTIVSSGTVDQIAGSRAVLSFGNFAGSIAGSLDLKSAPSPRASLRGDTASATLSSSGSEGNTSNNYQTQVMAATYDVAGTTIATELGIYNRGVLVTGAETGSTAGGGNLGNSVFTAGKAFNSLWYHKGIINRQFAINRILTPTELAQVMRWTRSGMAYCAVLGDSTVGALASNVALPNAMRISALVGGMVCGAADVSLAGDRISHQKAAWTAIPDKSVLEAVFIQIGLNDVAGRVGADTATSAQVIADYQDLVNTVNADKPAACKVFVSQITPCKAWLGTATNPAAAYQAWLDLNEAIAGSGATPITSVTARITSHTALLNDGAGNLLPIYDYNGDGVHESNEARFIIAQAWRTAAEANGVL